MSDCGKQQTPIQLQTQRKSLGLSEMGAPQNWASDFRREDTAWLLLVTPRWGKETDSRLLKKALQPRKGCGCCQRELSLLQDKEKNSQKRRKPQFPSTLPASLPLVYPTGQEKMQFAEPPSRNHKAGLKLEDNSLITSTEV